MFILFRTLILLFFVLLILSAILALAYVRSRSARKRKHKSANLTRQADAGVRNLLAEGRYDEALDVYQRFTAADEFTAKIALEQMQRELRLSDGLRNEIKSFLQADNKAAAIEAYQDATDASLSEALQVVEDVEKRRR